jgi:hypothetical protein
MNLSEADSEVTWSRLRTEERQLEKLKVLSDANGGQSSSSDAVKKAVVDQGAGSPSAMKGYVRRDDGELKPVRLTLLPSPFSSLLIAASRSPDYTSKLN